RDYDGLIGHITIVMSRYIFLSFEQRCHDDPRTIGSLFYACSDELQDIDFMSALQKMIAIAIEKIRSAGVVTEDVALAIVDSVMSTAIDLLQTNRRLSKI
ncbi:MAG: IS4 family transposase, partial [Candidatus Electrothrix sp. AR4]|nr:IS4 family transposase [Candidatus Electrothrix sp. AR4]